MIVLKNGSENVIIEFLFLLVLNFPSNPKLVRQTHMSKCLYRGQILDTLDQELTLCIDCLIVIINTPGTRGGPGGRDRTLAMKARKNARKSSYAKILGETNVQPREFPRSGSKAKDVKEEEREKSESKRLQWSVPVT